MIGRIVVTSVPHGLGGIGGFQPVWRTKGLSDPIAERMAARATYSHPLSPGDPANPVVFFHRIETVGSRTFHLIGSARDAGSDYSGRSNYLAELIAIDPEETAGLPGGPLFVASRFPWIERWSGDPREASASEEPPLARSEDPAGFCKAWERATGDAGWAGALASTFLDGRRAFLWSPRTVIADHRETLELFREAASLLPSSQRWTLTFNSCEIDPFPVLWRGVRADLPVVGPRPTAQDFNRDLDGLRKSGERAPDSPLARAARGQAAENPTRAPARPRRSGASVGRRIEPIRTAHPASRIDPIYPAERRGHWLLPLLVQLTSVAVVAVVGAVALYVHINPGKFGSEFPQLPRTNAPQSRSTAQGFPPPGHDLRSLEEERDAKRRRDQQTEKENNEKRERERQERERTSKEQAEKADEAQREKDRKAVEASRRRIQAQKDDEQKLRLQTDAITALTGQQIIPLLPAHNVLEDSGRLEPHSLCDFDIDNLMDPRLDLACVFPPGDQRRLTIQPEEGSTGPGRSRVWTVQGQIDQFTIDREEKPQQIVCRFVARDKRLYLEWPKADEPELKPGHELFSRLEYSVLLIASADPSKPDSKPEVRRQIHFVEPVEVKEPELDPLANDGKGLKKDLESTTDRSIAERLAKVFAGPGPQLRFQYRIDFDHPFFKDKALRSSSAEQAEFMHEIHIQYHKRIDSPDAWSLVDKTLTYSFTITFDPTKAMLSLLPVKNGKADADGSVLRLSKEDTVVGAVLTAKQIKGGREDLKKLQKTLSDALQGQNGSDPEIKRLRNDILNETIKRDAIPPPGSLGNPGLNRGPRGNVPVYESQIKTHNESIRASTEKLKNRTNANDEKYGSDLEKIMETMAMKKCLFNAVTARIISFQIMAIDADGREYPIDIVQPVAAEQ